MAPNAPLRAAVTALVQPTSAPGPAPANPAAADEGGWRSPARYLWAVLLARLDEAMPLACPIGSADMRIVAFITEGTTVRRILKHIGEPTDPPRISPARVPPAWWDEGAGRPEAVEQAFPPFDRLAQPEPDFSFDQTVSW